jgi:HK97 family phage prohead protease
LYFNREKMSNKTNSYNLKASSIGIRDFDEGSRKVAMYLSKFDIIDSDTDIIRKGAFTKSIQERGPGSNSNRKIAFLRYHNWEKPIGKFLELNEDETGLFAVAQLSQSSDGTDAMADYKDGIIREHSIGFQYIQDKIKFIDMGDSSYFDVTEVKLYEGSAVLFGANEFTNTVQVSKAEDKISYALKLHDEINLIGKALASGNGTDERLYSLEMKLKFLNARLFELAKSEPFVKEHSPIIEPIESPTFNWNTVINKL